MCIAYVYAVASAFWGVADLNIRMGVGLMGDKELIGMIEKMSLTPGVNVNIGPIEILKIKNTALPLLSSRSSGARPPLSGSRPTPAPAEGGEKAYVLTFLQSKGVTLDVESVDVMIESAVYELTHGFIEIGAPVAVVDGQDG